MEFGPLPGRKNIIYGEGAVSPVFVGSVYMRDDGESKQSADGRFEKAMNLMGFEWLGAGKKQ